MNKIFVLITILLSILLSACGKGVVDVSNESYEPKIVIEGFLVAHQKVDNIRISRNFPIGANLQKLSLLPKAHQTFVLIYDLATEMHCALSFHSNEHNSLDSCYWYDAHNQLNIRPGQSYRLEVRATIEGKKLYAWATTTVPPEGFRIAHQNYDSLRYRERDAEGNLKGFSMLIDRAPGTTFYLTTMRALNTGPENFIYDNPYVHLEPDEVEDETDNFDYNWLQNTPSVAGQSKVDFYWISLLFYGTYEVIIYAADKNYTQFVQTYRYVQEPDGNFHEAKFAVEGDGIGVFGSMVADTTAIKVLRD